MHCFPELIFPRYTFRLQRKGEQLKLWDEVRRQWLVLTPEEWVRQHLIRYLQEHCKVPFGLIAQENPVVLNGMRQRADVVVYGLNGQPCLMAECKAPEVALDGDVLAQAVRYNSVLGAPVLILTNGRRLVCCTRNAQQQWSPVDRIPDLSPFFGVQQL